MIENSKNEYPKPSLTVDVIVVHDNEVLLIKRLNDPFKDSWALPGGYVDEGEDIIEAAARELSEETNIKDLPLNQMGTYGKPGRDPRGWVVSVAYWSKLETKPAFKAGDDAKEAKWFPLAELPNLAFDHKEILNDFISKVIS